MRDLKRRICNSLAVHDLTKAGLEVFTPMTQMVMTIGGRRQRRDVPVIQDLLFVHESKQTLDPFVELYSTLQYRFQRGKSVNEPMTVRDAEMERFIRAVSTDDTPIYYKPGEINESMYGRTVRIIGGPLNGYEGSLLATRGSKIKRLLIGLQQMLFVSIEINPEYIELLR